MKEMYRDQFGEFVCGYWGLKGLTGQSWCILKSLYTGEEGPEQKDLGADRRRT